VLRPAALQSLAIAGSAFCAPLILSSHTDPASLTARFSQKSLAPISKNLISPPTETP
jgi:hypothetical protein